MDISTFLFGPYPLAMQPIDKIFFWVAAGSLVLAAGLWLINFFKKFNIVNHKLIDRFIILFFTFGLVGVVWVGIRYQNPLYLSWRLWYVLLMVVCTIWLVKILWYVLRKYKKDLADYRKNELKQKYLKR